MRRVCSGQDRLDVQGDVYVGFGVLADERCRVGSTSIGRLIVVRGVVDQEIQMRSSNSNSEERLDLGGVHVRTIVAAVEMRAIFDPLPQGVAEWEERCCGHGVALQTHRERRLHRVGECRVFRLEGSPRTLLEAPGAFIPMPVPRGRR